MRTHPLSVTYLVVGLIFLGLAGSWGLQEAGAVGFDDIGWLVPLTLVVAGAVGLLAAAAKGVLRRRSTGPDATHEETDEHPDYYLPDYTSDIEEKLR